MYIIFCSTCLISALIIFSRVRAAHGTSVSILADFGPNNVVMLDTTPFISRTFKVPFNLFNPTIWPLLQCLIINSSHTSNTLRSNTNFSLKFSVISCLSNSVRKITWWGSIFQDKIILFHKSKRFVNFLKFQRRFRNCHQRSHTGRLRTGHLDATTLILDCCSYLDHHQEYPWLGLRRYHGLFLFKKIR